MTAAPRTLNSWMQSSRTRIELLVAAVLALVGIGLTVFGAFALASWANAPGATLALIGGAWLGNVFARGDVPLLGQRATRPERSDA